jgi:uncharacterized membrane protein (DUF106 family)
LTCTSIACVAAEKIFENTLCITTELSTHNAVDINTLEDLRKKMKKSKPLLRRQLKNNKNRRLQMIKRMHQKVLQRRREFVRAELIEQWSVAC